MCPGRFVGRMSDGQAGSDRGLRALRILPADVPDVPAVGRGDGLAARPDLPDEASARRRTARRQHGAALRRLPRLHVVRDGVPVRSAVRRADRVDARPRSSATVERKPTDRALRRMIFAAVPVSAPAARRCGRRCAPTSRQAAPAARRASGCAARLGDDGRACCRSSVARQPIAEVTPAVGEKRMRVGMLLGCVQREFFPGCQRRDRARACGRGLRGRRASRAEVLRRAVAALRPGGGGARAREAADRHLRGSRRRRGRHQRRRVAARR